MAIIRRTSEKTGKVSYLVRVETEAADGSRKQRSVGTYRTKALAEKAERNALTKRDNGTLFLPEPVAPEPEPVIKIGYLLDTWLKSKRGNISDQSWADYEIIVRKHLKPAFGDTDVTTLTPLVLTKQYQTWRDEKSAHVVIECHRRLSQVLDFAVMMGIIAANICKSVKPPTVQPDKQPVWDETQFWQFLDIAGGVTAPTGKDHYGKDRVASRDWLHPLWHLLLLEGMRRGEALGLRWSDIDLERGKAHILQTVIVDKMNKGATAIQNRTKTGAGSRSVRLTLETITALKDHRKVWLARQMESSAWQPFDLVICTRNGGPISPRNVSRSFEALIEASGLPRIRVHDLRHSSATHLLRAGVAGKVVSERLGHTRVSFTLDRYSHVLPDMQDTAALAFSRPTAVKDGAA